MMQYINYVIVFKSFFIEILIYLRYLRMKNTEDFQNIDI